MRLVTTCNREGYERYAHRVLDGWHHWPAGTELHWYVEGFTLPKDRPESIIEISTDKLQALQTFKLRHGGFVPPNYLFDVVRFSHKVFAAADALQDYKGIGVWMDADVVTKADIPAGYVETLVKDAYLAMFKRRGMYTETGFWVMDCAHEQHESFLGVWTDWYESGAFRGLQNWTDCETLDATVRKFERQDLIRTVSLSGEFEKDMHPMAKAPLSAYLDHCKGNRKDLGYSPERAA